MANRNGNDLQIMLWGGFDLHGYMNSLPSLAGTAILEDVTPFGTTDQVFANAGKNGRKLSLSGFYDDATLGSNTALVGQLAATAPLCVGVAGNTVGAPFEGMTGVQGTVDRTAMVGKISKIAATFVSTGEYDMGLIQQPLGAVTSNSNSTSINGTASSTYGLVAYLQMPALTLGTATGITVKLQDSADNVTFADISGGAFTAVTANITTTPVAQRLVIPGTIRQYTRAAWTWTGGAGGGSTATIFVGIFRGATANVFAPAPFGLGDNSPLPEDNTESATAAAGEATGAPPPRVRRASPAATAAEQPTGDSSREE